MEMRRQDSTNSRTQTTHVHTPNKRQVILLVELKVYPSISKKKGRDQNKVDEATSSTHHTRMINLHLESAAIMGISQLSSLQCPARELKTMFHTKDTACTQPTCHSSGRKRN